jgi:hypothetical protein
MLEFIQPYRISTELIFFKSAIIFYLPVCGDGTGTPFPNRGSLEAVTPPFFLRPDRSHSTVLYLFTGKY